MVAVCIQTPVLISHSSLERLNATPLRVLAGKVGLSSFRTRFNLAIDNVFLHLEPCCCFHCFLISVVLLRCSVGNLATLFCERDVAFCVPMLRCAGVDNRSS